MRKKAAITSGVAAAVLGGGLALALNGGGAASAAGTPASAHPAVASPAAAISRSGAEKLALTAVGGGRVRSAELEDEHGAAVWSVKVIKAGVTHEVRVGARTGRVVPDRPRAGEAGRHDDDPATCRDHADEAEHRRHEPEARDDRARDDERRHDGDDATEDHRYGDDDHDDDDHDHDHDDDDHDDGNRGRG